MNSGRLSPSSDSTSRVRYSSTVCLVEKMCLEEVERGCSEAKVLLRWPF